MFLLTILSKLNVSLDLYKTRIISPNPIRKNDEGIMKKKQKYYPSRLQQYQIPNKKIRSLTIQSLLVRSNLEVNPGPQNTDKAKVIDVLTFNCNGMANKQKFKRIMSKCNKIADRGGIVMLQETHLMKAEQISFMTKNNFQFSHFRSNSAGVLTLYGKEYQTIYTKKDNEGRQLYTVIQEGEIKLLIVNIDCCNDHRQSIKLIEEVYCNILATINEIPDCHVILGGDFNSCMTREDFMNRNWMQVEEELTKSIRANNKVCNLIDSYNLNKKTAGYTWSRGNCYSRLDYIYLSADLSNKVVSSVVDWAFEKLDHAAVKTSIKILTEVRKDPGISKVNVAILNDNNKKDQISKELDFLLLQIPSDWNGHMKLEYAKMAIRSTLAKYTSVKRAEEKNELELLENSLNDIEKLKQKVLRNLDNIQLESKKKLVLEKVEEAKLSIKTKLESMRRITAAEKDFRSAAKWYEYGEKPNKFFFDQTKFKSKQKVISEIVDGNTKYVGHNEVIKGVKAFYQKLYSKEDRHDEQTRDDSFLRNVQNYRR